jgi:hypothetical protein
MTPRCTERIAVGPRLGATGRRDTGRHAMLRGVPGTPAGEQGQRVRRQATCFP